MMSYIETLPPLLQLFAWLLVCFAIFTPLAIFFPNNPRQALFRRGMITDLFYWFLGPFVYSNFLHWFLFGFASLMLYDAIRVNSFVIGGFGMLSELSIALQCFIVFLLTDLLQYWAHRIFHEAPFWKFHSIHHSSLEVDWLSTIRFHPVNYVAQILLPSFVVFTLGFSPTTFALIVPLNILYSAMVHANLRFTFGPLKYILASPVFHRWHHTLPSEGGDKNFAPTFSFLDLLFGTFYMPAGRYPKPFGTALPLPQDFVGQLAHPFRRNAKKGAGGL